ncbi:hypothetical protein Tco_1532382 [Tanacetum coccineum]
MYLRFLQLFLNNQIENLEAVFNDKYDTPFYTKKVFANMRRQGKDFSVTITPLFATMLIQPQAVEGEGSGQPTKPQHTPTTASPSNIEPIPIIASSSHPKKTHKHRKTKRKATKISQSSGPTTLVADETVHEEREYGTRRQDTILGDKPVQTRFERLSKQSNDPPLSRVNTLGSVEDRLKIMELMEICTKLSDREDASKQGRNIAESDQDEEISFVQQDAETQGEKLKERSKEKRVSSETALRPTRGVTIQEYSESRTRQSLPPPQHDLKDKGKDKMIKPGNLSKKKDQIKLDEEMTKRLAEELEAELEEEEKLAKQREEEDNLISWDNTQAMIEADYELAQRLQAEEQGETNYFEEIQMLFDNAMKWIDLFVPMDSEVVEGSKSQAEGKIVPRDDEAINVESLATKYLIVDWKTHILTEDKMYYEIIRADGSTKFYKIFTAMLDDFDRQDVLDLYRLVKERFETTIHVLLMDTGITIHMMVEKKYPLTPEMLSRMLSGKLEVDRECEMAYELLRFTRSQLKK